MADIQLKKVFFGGKRPAQRVVVQEVVGTSAGEGVVVGQDEAVTPPVVVPSSLFPWGVSESHASSVVQKDTATTQDDEESSEKSCCRQRVQLVSPVPLDSWKGFENRADIEGGNDDDDDALRVSCCSSRDDVLVAWLNAVLDPWGTGKSAALGSHVVMYLHKDVLKDRIRRQWMVWSLKDELLVEPVTRVSKRIARDVIGLAKRVEHVVQTPALHSRIEKGFRSYSYVWLQVAHEILSGKGVDALSAKEEEWLCRILSIPLNTNHRQGTTRKNHVQYYCGKLSPHGYARVIKRILAILVFLDKVFSSSWTIPLWAPPLFDVGQANSSHHALQETLGLLLDQVDVCRYLHRFGCTVSYIQPQSRCATFHVNNLAVDLRDGVKLCRVSEMLVGSSLEPVYPATKASERIGNIRLALTSMGLCAPGVAEHIADGHHAATLGVLWDCVVKFELEKTLNVFAIQLECDCILASVQDVQRVTNDDDDDDDTSWKRYPAVSSILRWIRCLCAFGGVVVDDLFDNPRDRICVLESFLSYYAHCSAGSLRSKPSIFDRIDYMLRGCGGIPRLLTMDEYTHGSDVDHRQLVVFYALLCKRVLCMNYEHRAAIVIQRFWRHACHRKPGYARQHLEKWIDAARVIQRNVRPFLCRRRVEQSASSRRVFYERIVDTQARWRGIMAVRRFHAMKDAALAIQTQWRAYRARGVHITMQKQHGAAVTIQACWRRHHSLQYFDRARMASIVIEKHWRSYECRTRFFVMRQAAVAIQRHGRRLLVQRYMEARWRAALVIQNHYRAHKVRQEYEGMIDASQIIQKHWRRFHAQQQALTRVTAVITIQRHCRKFKEWRLRRIHSMLEDHTDRLSKAMKEYSIQFVNEYREDRAKRLALHEQERKTTAARIIQTGWRSFRTRRDVSVYLIDLYEKSKTKVEMNKMYGSAATVIQAWYRTHNLCKNHPLADEMAHIRRRLMEATERARVLQEEGVDDPTTLWNMMQRAMTDLDRGNVLPDKDTLQDLTTCLGSSSSCCTAFLREGGVDYIMKAMIHVSRDKYRHDSIIQACACLESLTGCGRFVDHVGQIVLDSGYMETLTMLTFQLRDNHEPFHALVSLLGVLANSRRFSEKVSSSKDLSNKLIGVHRNLRVKHGQVASYLKKLEGRKGSDISAANATRMLFKMGHQISALEKLMGKMQLTPQEESKGQEPYKAEGKNTIVRQVLREISTNTTNI